ncbi:MAG: OmpH family outer membrane protein [Prevotellaceae bacterium]|jgi:outer membrane protein|nr:OmpH family outer membrane protein [Prevotellaceae bacterium]
MKKFLLLIAAVVFFASCKNPQNNGQNAIEAKESSTVNSNLAVAVVNVDTILLYYKFAIAEREKLFKKVEDAKLRQTKQEQQFQSEYADFMNKAQNNAFLSNARAESESKRLQKKYEDLEKQAAKIDYDFAVVQNSLAKQFHDSIIYAVNKINNGRFSLVLPNDTLNTNVLYFDKLMNISAEVLEFLNKRCK